MGEETQLGDGTNYASSGTSSASTPKVSVSSDFALRYTWKKTRDPACTDAAVCLYTSGFIDSDNITSSCVVDGTSESYGSEGTSIFADGYEMVVVRVDSTLVVQITIELVTGKTVVYTKTVTEFSEDDLAVCLNSYLYWIDDITYQEGTIN